MILTNGSANDYLHDYKDGKIALGLGIGIGLDDNLRFKFGQFVGVLGSDNVGKSYWVLWYFLSLSVTNNLKWGIWMDENSKGQVLRDLIQIYAGVRFNSLTHEQINGYAHHIESYFTFIDNKQTYTPDKLLEQFALIQADGFFIDPFNQLDHDMEYSANIKFIRKLKMWCKQNRKTVYLSMHPVTSAGRKSAEYPKGHIWEFQPSVPNKSMAEGGKLFANMADDWINVHRLTKLNSMKDVTLIDIDKVKDKDTGGAPTMSSEPLMFFFNRGLGFTQNGKEPFKRVKEMSTMKPNNNF